MVVCFRAGINRSISVCSLKSSAQLLSQLPAAEVIDGGFFLKNEGKDHLLNITLSSSRLQVAFKKLQNFYQNQMLGV